MAETQQTIDNANAIKAIIDGSKTINGLTPLTSQLNLQDKIALYRNATGETLNTTIEQLRDSGVGSSSINYQFPLSFTIDSVTKGQINNIWGGIQQVVTAQPLSTGVNAVGNGGRTKLMLVVKAGTDINGTATITGRKVDRDTGIITPGFTEDIIIDSLSIDGSSLDGLGNDLHNFTNCYMSTEWYDDGFVISTTDLNISNLDVWSVAFNQFNGITPVTVDTIDMTATITNGAAEFSGHAYSVEVVNGKSSIVAFADYEMPSAESNVGLYRFKSSGLAKELNTATDGIFVDVFFMPINSSYFENVALLLWAESSQSVNVIVDGSLGLDSIVYGESLQIGDGVYLNTDGKYYIWDNTSELTSTTELRLILEAGILNDEKIALAKGQYVGTGFTAGNEYVGTNGTVTSSRPTLASETARIVSTAINATTRYFDPSKTWINGTASKINGVTIAGAGTNFLDNIFTILNATDQTKKIQFDASLITSGETITAQVQGRDGVLAYLDDILVGGGSATSITTDTTNFDNNLSAADNTVQKALDTLDNIDFLTIADLPPVSNPLPLDYSVIWTKVGLVFDCTASRYYIVDTYYSATPTQITLDAADVTDDRIDLIVANSSGVISKITGIPAPSPAEPNYDLNTQFPLNFILVQANQTVPVINDTVVYNEDLGVGGSEWDKNVNTIPIYDVNGWVSGDYGSIEQAYEGTKSLKLTLADADYGIWSDATGVLLDDITAVTFWIKIPVATPSGTLQFINYWSENDSITDFEFITYTEAINLGIDDKNPNWQKATIPLVAYKNIFVQNYGSLKYLKTIGMQFRLVGSTEFIYVDKLEIQTNATTQPPVISDKNLQDITDIGNTTTNDILVSTEDDTKVIRVEIPSEAPNTYSELRNDGTITAARDSHYVKLDGSSPQIDFKLNPFIGALTPSITDDRSWELPDKSGTIALLSDVSGAEPSQITITTAVSITTDTTDGTYSQSGKNTIIDNGVNAINLTVNGGVGFVSSYLKHGTGAITFVQGAGRTLIQVDSTAVLDGAVGSTATISSIGTTDYLRISNAV